VEKINKQQKLIVIKKVREFLWNLRGKSVGVLGLAFKPGTDDIRESPAIGIINLLLEEGCILKCYDPRAMENAKKVLSDVEFCENAYDVARDAHLIIFATEWDEFKNIDFETILHLMKMPYIIDGRNFLNLDKLKKSGFICCGIGRKMEKK